MNTNCTTFEKIDVTGLFQPVTEVDEVAVTIAKAVFSLQCDARACKDGEQAVIYLAQADALQAALDALMGKPQMLKMLALGN